jgi:hypothetical protein
VNVKFPELSVVVDRAVAPDNATVAADPLTFPEMLYVVGAVLDPVKFTPDTEAPAIDTEIDAGVNAYSALDGMTT